MNVKLCVIIIQAFLIIGQISARPNSWHRSQRVTRDASTLVTDQAGPESELELEMRDSAAGRGSFLELEEIPPKRMSVQLHSNVVIQCEAVGTPAPKMYWLKNGIPLESQETLTNEEKSSSAFAMSKVQSKLRLQCIIPEDEAEYTCVAQNGHEKITATTTVVIEEDDTSEEIRSECEYRLPMVFPKSGASAYISSIETMHMENLGNDIILPCQAQGQPRPKTSWIDNNGRPILSNQRLQINSKGQLLIRDLRWDDMGEFSCVVENSFGSDLASTFVYPLQMDSL